MTLADTISSLTSLIALGLLFGSIKFWIYFVQKLRAGENPVPWRFRPQLIPVSKFAVVLTLALLLISATAVLNANVDMSQMPLKDIRTGLVLGIGESAVVITMLLSAIFVEGYVTSRTSLQRLGFRFDNVAQQVREGMIALAASVIPVAIAILLTIPLRSEETMHPYLRLLRESKAEALLLIFLAAVVLAPLKEELMFRVVFQTWLEKYCTPNMAVALSSITFALVHGVPDSLALLPLAVVLGVLYQRRRSYISVVTTHALFNAYNVLAVLGT